MATKKENNSEVSPQTKVYVLILIASIILVVILLLFYYLQPIENKVSLLDNIDYSKIDFRTRESINYQINQNEIILEKATVKIGSVQVINKGYFPYVYRLPIYHGCIIFSDNFQMEKEKYNPTNEIKITTNFENEYQLEESLEVQVGDSLTKDLYAHYNPNIPIYLFKKENIKEIKIYEIPQKNENPLSQNYNYRYFYGYSLCDSLMQEKEPIKTITLN